MGGALGYAVGDRDSGAEPEFVQFPRAAFEFLLTGLPLAA